MNKKWLPIFFCLFLTAAAIFTISPSGDINTFLVSSDYLQHNPIYISGNNDFSEQNGVISGDGTCDDPYVIQGWEINADSADGIVIRNTSVYFVIKNCFIHDGEGEHDGIKFYNVTNAVIENNTVTGNRNGIVFSPQINGKENSENNIIQGNDITNNLNNGICFEHTGIGYHKNNTILRNKISRNNIGIFMIMSANNKIIQNNIMLNNQWGIRLEMCMGGGENNHIYHNNFFNNEDKKGQASEIGDPHNKWYNDYPIGGNYWSDYHGSDKFKGPDQNINGADGIGDKPYSITGGKNQDKYPLTKPVNTSAPGPIVFIEKPDDAFYVNNVKIIPFLIPVIIGDINIEITAFDKENIDHVELFIDSIKVYNSTEEPFQWFWSEPFFGKKTLRAAAYNNNSGKAEDIITVWRFF